MVGNSQLSCSPPAELLEQDELKRLEGGLSRVGAVRPGGLRRRSGPMQRPVQCQAWAAALAAYVVYMRASGFRPGTVEMRAYWLRRVAAQYAGRSPWELTTADLAGFISVEHWSPETRRAGLNAIRGFYRWAADAQRCTVNPALGLASVRVPPGRARPTPTDVVAAASQSGDARERVMVMLAAYAGLRRAEIAGLHSEHIQGAELRVVGKGGRIRNVPAHPALLDEIRSYVAGRSGWLFPSEQTGGHLTPPHVGKIMSRLLGPGWTAHTLRHRFATAAYAATNDLVAVQALLGHSKPETTVRYIAIADPRLEAAVMGAGPLPSGSRGRIMTTGGGCDEQQVQRMRT